MIDREALRAAYFTGRGTSAMGLIAKIKELGYKRGQFPNGIQVVTNGDDWLRLPPFFYNEGQHTIAAWESIEVIQIQK